MFSASVASPAIAVALDQRRRIEARGVERLQDVVARRGEEPRLRDVGLLGLAPWRVVSASLRRVSSSVRSRTRRSSVSLARSALPPPPPCR